MRLILIPEKEPKNRLKLIPLTVSKVIELRKSKSMGALFVSLIGFMLVLVSLNLFSIRDSSRPSKITASCYDFEGKRLDVPLQLMGLGSGRYRIGVDELQNKELRIQLVPDHKNFQRGLRPDFSAQQSAEGDSNLHQVVETERKAGQEKMGQIPQNFCGRVLEADRAQFLMIRKGSDIREKSAITSVQVSVLNGPTVEIADSKRVFIPLSHTQNSVEFKIHPQNQALPLVLDEVGLYQKVPKTFLAKSQAKLLSLIVFGVVAAAAFWIFRNLDGKFRNILGALFCFIFAGLVHTSILAVSCNPEYNRDLKVIFASGTLQEAPECNLNYGLYMASSILQGKGPLIVDSPPWCRMPGYGYLLALAGSPFNLLQMATKALAIQSLFFALSVAFFFWASTKIMQVQASLLTSMIACFITYLPPTAYYLQIESIMPAIVLLVLGTSCLFYDQMVRAQKIPLIYHVLLHLSFAIWFFMRTDILPAWGLMSLFLYAKRISDWKYFSLPCILVTCIALPWGLFKMPYTQEFSMTTNSVGASMMVGLWEIPHDFIWEISDESYHEWASNLGLDSNSKSASDFAVHEVIRFWLTFPFYTLGLWFHKFLLFASGSGAITCGSNWLKLYLLAVILLSFFLKHKRAQTFMLSFLVFFNVPIFFQFFSSSGRFYHAPSICLFAAALSLLFDSEFHQKLIKNKKMVCAVIVLTFVFTQIAPQIDAFLIQNKALRSYSPFLDPAHSTLSLYKKEEAMRALPIFD